MLTLTKALLALLSLSQVSLAAGRKVSRQSTSTTSYPQFSNVTSNSTNPVSLKVLTKTGVRNTTAPYLYGWMFEDINHSGDGGLYGELLTNGAFEGSTVTWEPIPDYFGKSITYQENACEAYGPVLTGYKPVGNTLLRLDNLHPLSHSHQTVLELDIPTNSSNSTGPVGFQNMGWWGIPVTPQVYNVSFYVYPDQVRNRAVPSTSITVSLQSNITGEIWASVKIPAQEWNVVNWTLISTQIENTVTAPDSNNTLAITFDSVEAVGQTYYFSQISLFGETFKGYQNGLRKDLAQNIYDLKPTFLRWPGGNNLEGYSVQRRWKWWETIGPLSDRWARPGNWEYYNTNGLGLLEFLEWTESMEMDNVLGIYSGYSLGDAGQSNTVEFPATEEAMYPVLKEALDELEFCMGSVDTYWGAKRAEYGHPEPFNIKFIEIGNEDWFGLNYPFRFRYLYDGLKAAYPDIQYISSAYNENPLYTIDLPPGTTWDTHHYEEPAFFIENFDFFDNWQEVTNNTNVTVMIGEYSVIQVDTPDRLVNFSFPADVHISYPRLVSGLAEGVYLLGAERNPNVVTMSSYAPSLQNFNWYNWSPNLIAFDANPENTVLSVSYYLQKLFNAYRGTESVEVTNTGDFNPLYWAAAVDGDKSVILKVINIANTSISLTVELETAWSSVNGTIITGPDPNGFNYRNNQTAIVPIPLNLTSSTPSVDGEWTWNVPSYSITVLEFKP
ncbi:alpha-N-arabinofuranosidase A [Phlyctema vagabunda]|uniref:non-reducing end alpha-L-arabinofuranosidase n=1 Tax=Phlyctema vagabunda TaxID=108571 RepID=A0ABR4PPM9_9HELO